MVCIPIHYPDFHVTTNVSRGTWLVREALRLYYSHLVGVFTTPTWWVLKGEVAGTHSTFALCSVLSWLKTCICSSTIFGTSFALVLNAHWILIWQGFSHLNLRKPMQERPVRRRQAMMTGKPLFYWLQWCLASRIYPMYFSVAVFTCVGGTNKIKCFKI